MQTIDSISSETKKESKIETKNNVPARQLLDASHLPDLAGLTALITHSAAPHDLTTIRAPFNGQVLGTVPICTLEDVQAALRAARNAQPAWAQTGMSQRKAIFLRFHDLILQHQPELLDLLQAETGKNRLSAQDEVFDVVINCRHYAVRAAGYLRPRRRKGAIPLLTHTVELHQPLGVVGIITPWNYPLALTISDAVPALLAGNAVVLKPAEETPFIALYAASLLYQAGLPRELFQIVTGKGRLIGPELIKSVDYLGFTGGTATGRLLAAQAGERLIKCSLELGGKNAGIVLDDADLETAVPGILRGSFANTGQLCVHMERVYVQDGIYERFVPELLRQVQAMQVSPAFDFSVDMGSLLSQGQLDKVTRHVADALSKGAVLLTGGKARPDLGPFFYEPTLLTNVQPGMNLYAEETFGPVLSIYRFEAVEQAIQSVNASAYGLNSSVWTKNVRRGQQIATRLQTGTSNVNEAVNAAWGSIDSPMGGMKASGLGRRHGMEGLLKYTESRTVATQSLMLIGPSRFLPPERYAKAMTLILKLMKSIPGLR